MVTLPINQKYVEAINDNVGDIVSDQVNNLIFSSLEDIASYINEFGDQANDQAGDIVSNQVNNLASNSLEEIIAFSNGVSNQVSNQAGNQAGDIADSTVRNRIRIILEEQIHDKVEDILNLTNQWIRKDELFTEINMSNQSKNRKKYLDPLLKIGWVEMEFPDKRTSPNQRYRITESGKNLLKIIRKKG